MADLNKTIDRSMAISRNVAGLYAGRQGPTPTTASHLKRGQSEYTAGGPAAAMVVRLGRVLDRRGPAPRAVLGHDPRARQPVDRTRERRQAAAAALPLRDARGCAHVRASVQPRAGAHRAAGRHENRRHEAPVHHHRPARRPRPGHRRLQGRLAGRRRAARRSRGLLRDLLPRAGARADARRRHRRGGGVRPHRRRAPSRQPEALAHRQLPGHGL